MMSGSVDTTNKDLHARDGRRRAATAGIGLSYCACSTVASFSQVQFTVSGSWPGCDLQMQIKTFDQTPTSQNPMGGCDASSCYNYPAALQVAAPSSTPMTITTPLSSFSNWTSVSAAEVVGLQWQWTYSGSPPPPTAARTPHRRRGRSPCPIDASITNIKFLP